MTLDRWLALAAIVAGVVVTAASWVIARRRSVRDDLLQDIQIRDALEDGPIRMRLEDSIDERVFVMAFLAERRRNPLWIQVGLLLLWLAFAAAYMYAANDQSWAIWVAGALSLAGTVAFVHGTTLSHGKRLTPARIASSGVAARPGPPAPPAAASAPGQPGSPESPEPPADPAAPPAEPDAPPPRP